MGDPPRGAARVGGLDVRVETGEIISAAGNGITLLVVSAVVAFEAIRSVTVPAFG